MAEGVDHSAARLSDRDLLHVWEAGGVQHPLDRALSILVAAEADSPRSELARLPRGRRDARLLAVYARTFGSAIEGLGRCPECRERVEFRLDVGELLSVSGETSREGPFTIASAGCEVTFRLPDSYDLAEIVGLTDVDAAHRRLLRRCMVHSTREGQEIGPEEVPEAVIALVVGQMADFDPLGEIELVLDCPRCGNEWSLVFDIESFLWRKIEERANRLLREVHTLASAYGWHEADILALTAARRRAYLEMIS